MVNIYWLEYEYYYNHRKKYYPELLTDSFLKSLQLDTLAWRRCSPYNEPYVEIYYRHPAFSYYPLVGVTYEQAKAFAKWRSDRVFEYYLIATGLYKEWDSTIIFTIEDYFNGKIEGLTPDYNLYYPEYSLPDSTTYYRAAVFADSLNKINILKRKRRIKLMHPFKRFPNGVDECYSTSLFCYNSCDKEELEKFNTCFPVKAFCMDVSRKFNNKTPIISHLKGNVREMTNTKNVYYGLGYNDSCNLDYNKCRIDTNMPNAYTGFRMICRYKKWNPKEGK